MQGKIALEEHLAIEATLGDSKVFGAHVWDTLHPRLFDVQEIRLREMDKHGIEMMILSQPNRIEVPLWLFIALAVLAAADTIFVTWIVF